MNSTLCSSDRERENALSKIILIASSLSIFVSCKSINSPIFDHCYDVSVSASSGVTINLKVTISLSSSNSLLVNDSFLSFSSSRYVYSPYKSLS